MRPNPNISHFRRNYVKKKKSLRDSMTMIKDTLEVIYANSHLPFDPNKIQKQAMDHAKQIEAACWVRHARFSDEIFQSRVRTKTYELCRMLLNMSSIPAAAVPRSLGQQCLAPINVPVDNKSKQNVEFETIAMTNNPQFQKPINGAMKQIQKDLLLNNEMKTEVEMQNCNNNFQTIITKNDNKIFENSNMKTEKPKVSLPSISSLLF